MPDSKEKEKTPQNDPQPGDEKSNGNAAPVFDNWINEQPEEVKVMLEGQTSGLKSALVSERESRKELEGKLTSFETSQKKAEEERLQKNEEYKTLAEKRAEEIATLTATAAVAEEQESALQEILEAQIKELPEDMRDIVPEGSTLEKSRWLAKHKEKFTKPAGPDIGAGVRGGTKETSIVLSAEQKAYAKSMGLTDKQYAEGINRTKE